MSSWRNSNPLQQQQQQHFMPHQPFLSQQPQHTNAAAAAALENGPRAKCDQVVFEAIAKAAEIVVGSRCWIDHLPPNISASSSSRRFNLLVPEVQGVRSILQRWKRALHVPLRLDVYYQHPDSRRELLERWCLEYAPKTATHHQGFAQSTDPIVQLRQVCKQIVIWMRTLYCWSRMLPAQALRSHNTQNNAIGFSIYVVSEGNDDVSGLVSQQGFSSQGQPHSVWTPYGELGWKVFYAPNSVVQRFIPEVPPYSPLTSSNGSRTSSQPIPMRPQQQQQPAQTHQPQSFHPSRDMVRRDSTPPSITARSAPQNTGRIMYQRSHSDVSDAQYHAISVTGGGLYANQHTAPSQSPSQFAPQTNSPSNRIIDTSNPPTKNFSALSLAMMSLSDDDPTNTTSSPTTTTAAAANAEAAEKRRAALHHAPPQLPQSSPNVNKKSPLASAGEYGYAYNNHIPPIRPPTNNTPPNAHPLPSPIASTPLGSTPPGYLLGAPTPPPSNWSNLIPPRGAVTPPFTRPMGFVGEPPSQPLPPPVQQQPHLSHHLQPNLAPTTSLDLLHSSPFRQPLYGNNFGSSMAPDPFNSIGSGIGGADLAFSSSPGRSGVMTMMMMHAHEDPDDMPFAVDATDDNETSSNAASALAASSSIIMRDMIQPPKRLQLFESVNASQQQQQQEQSMMGDDGMSALADQLAEFKSFGASLMGASTAAGGSAELDPTASTSTPITLRS